ncbi:MAG: leucyl aminopeptidase [Cryptosporangiaceae bacterium]|nr:leucyl aminopeptidase [Cryptosporangiaceae bacterium]MDQ1656960.1 leucyl aminopeptidase [Cryptosporangiaceae bacterium]
MSLVDVRLVTPRVRRGAQGALGALILPVAPADGDDPPALLPTAQPLPDAPVAEFVGSSGHGGKEGEVKVLPVPGGQPGLILLVGAGDRGPGALRKLGAAAVRNAGDRTSIAIALPDGSEPEGVRALAEGALLASYRYTLASKAEPRALRRVELVTDDPDRFAAALAAATAVAEGTEFARDMVNTPGGQKAPAWFAGQAVKAAAKVGVTAVVRDPARLADEGFHGILAVGSGSSRGPRLTELTWAPRGAKRHVVLVGKGITFDTGGISIKPAAGMQLMKKDMGGGAAVIGAVLAAAALELPVKITVLVPMAENMPSGTAYRPGDIVRHYGGRTSEIGNTDAEGRVVLADALAYAQARLKPDVLVDLATLTGAQGVALGKRIAALYSDNDGLAASLAAAAAEAGERVWRMPLPDDYIPALDSDYADLNNAPAGAGGGSITAALYLREFTGSARENWAHLDMSSPAWTDAPTDELTKGATGWGVRTLVRWLESYLSTDM